MNNFSKISVAFLAILLFGSIALTTVSAASNTVTYSRMTGGVLQVSNSSIGWNQTARFMESFTGGVPPYRYEFGVFQSNGKLVTSGRFTSNSTTGYYNFTLSAGNTTTQTLHIIAIVSDSPTVGDSIQSQNTIEVAAKPLVVAVPPVSVKPTTTLLPSNSIPQTPPSSATTNSYTNSSLIIKSGIIALTIIGIVFVGVGIFSKEKAKRKKAQVS